MLNASWPIASYPPTREVLTDQLYGPTPDALRERTPEEKEELRQAEETKRGLRYRAMYGLLGLKIVVQRDGTLDVSGTFGVRSMELGGEPMSVWKSVTRESAEDLPPPESYLEVEEDRCHDLRVPRRSRSRQQSVRLAKDDSANVACNGHL